MLFRQPWLHTEAYYQQPTTVNQLPNSISRKKYRIFKNEWDILNYSQTCLKYHLWPILTGMIFVQLFPSEIFFLKVAGHDLNRSNMEGLKGGVDGFSYFKWFSVISFSNQSLSPIQRGFAPGFVNYKKGCTRLAAACDKVYQLLAHGRWFSPASSTTKTGRHDIAEILLKNIF
jgi:hypothetical protein